MTVHELLEQLQILARNHGDVNIVCSVGVLKDIVQKKLKDDADWNLPAVCFLDDAVSVYVDEDAIDEGPAAVVIHAGADFEIPPAL